METPPRNLKEEGAPFTPEFKKVLLHICDEFDIFPTDTHTFEEISEFRAQCGQELNSSGCISKMCDVAAEALQKNDFVAEDGSMIESRFFPLYNMLENLINSSDISEEIRLVIGNHPSILPVMIKFCQDVHKPHLEKSLTVRICPIINHYTKKHWRR